MFDTILMEAGGAHPDGIPKSCRSLPPSPISQLPTELFVAILRLKLLSTDPMAENTEYYVSFYIRRLYSMRLVAKRWQEIIDGTAAFWTFILSTLPPDVSNMTIIRSNNGPLSLIYSSQVSGNGTKRLSPKDFLAAVAHTRPRWSAYSGPIVPEYLETPAPLLQQIKLWSNFVGGSGIKPLDLLGGYATRLRHVELSRVSIQWKLGMFTGLKSLTLEWVGQDGLKTRHLLDFLRASPYLENLKLRNIHATAEDTTTSALITLPRLQSISLFGCENSATECILQHIRAPACINLFLSVFGTASDELIYKFLDNPQLPFEGILRAIQECNGLSEIALHNYGFEWHTPAHDKARKFHVHLECASLIAGIRWVDRVLGSEPGLRIKFGSMINVSDAVLEAIAPMPCVTQVVVGGYQGERESLRILKYLAKPLNTRLSLPPLPCLRELILISVGWNAEVLLGMAHSRFDPRYWGTFDRPVLVIKMSRGAFSWTGSHRPIIDYTTLTRIRETNGVERVEFVGAKERDGMLAVIWNEEALQPLWC